MRQKSVAQVLLLGVHQDDLYQPAMFPVQVRISIIFVIKIAIGCMYVVGGCTIVAGKVFEMRTKVVRAARNSPVHIETVL